MNKTLLQCSVVSERQKLMADQIKIRRRQRKDTSLNIARAAFAGLPRHLEQLQALLHPTSPGDSISESSTQPPTPAEIAKPMPRLPPPLCLPFFDPFMFGNNDFLLQSFLAAYYEQHLRMQHSLFNL